MGKINSGVYPVYENEFMVGATKETATPISEMESCSVSIDNGVETWTPFTAEGWQSALQTAKAITISVSGKTNVYNGEPVEGAAYYLYEDAECTDLLCKLEKTNAKGLALSGKETLTQSTYYLKEVKEG